MTEIEQLVARTEEATTAFLRELRDVPCTDCGGRFAPHQMDFDHRDPGTKSFTPTSARIVSTQRILDEVAKCDVVCANCHRIRTHARRARVRSGRELLPGMDLARRRERWRAQARLLTELREVPCLDCGGTYPACAMDFDHRDQSHKRAGVTRMIGRAGTAQILAEAAKCDIVCANCHRVRTYARRARAERE
jgi:hypothetical protein